MKTAAKDFKMTELGPIPKDWEVKRLGELFDIGSSKRVFQSQWRDSGIPFWRARDIVSLNEGSGAIGGLYIDADLYSQYKSQYGVPAIGDLLVTAVGTLGEVYRVKDDKPFYFKDGNIIWLRNRGVCDSQFVEVLFAGGRLDDQIYDTAGGSTVGTYTITNANKTLIPLPPLPEQRKIAAALSNVDEMVAALEKLIEKKRKIKSGAMQRLLTGKTRLPGFKGAWVEKRLGDCAEVFCDGDWIESADQSDVGIRLVQTGNVGEGVFLDKADKKRFISEATFKRLNCCEIFAGDVLVSRLPDPAGRACRLPPSSERRITAVDCTIIRFNDLLAAEYFVAFSQTAGYYKQIDEQMAGSTRQRISRKALGDVVVSCPPTLAEQKAIAKVLGDMDEEIAALEAELAKTRQLKQGMMQELLTGKVRLV